MLPPRDQYVVDTSEFQGVTARLARIENKRKLMPGDSNSEPTLRRACASEVDTLILDKTGTVPVGAPVAAQIWPVKGESEEKLLAVAAACGFGSLHPVSRAVVAEASARTRDCAFGRSSGVAGARRDGSGGWPTGRLWALSPAGGSRYTRPIRRWRGRFPDLGRIRRPLPRQLCASR
jgi:hypothetical protein